MRSAQERVSGLGDAGGRDWAGRHGVAGHEVVRAGRRLLADGGADAVTLRAVARELGLSAPALHGHFDGRRGLLRAIGDDASASLTGELRAAVSRVPERDLSRVFVAAGFAFRNWALAHRHEYALLFDGSCGERFQRVIGSAFLALVVGHWDHRCPPGGASEEIPPALRRRFTGPGFDDPHLPSGVAWPLVDSWVRLQGFVALEAFGHLTFALPDATPLFERTLADIATRLTGQPAPWSAGGPAWRFAGGPVAR